MIKSEEPLLSMVYHLLYYCKWSFGNCQDNQSLETRIPGPIVVDTSTQRVCVIAQGPQEEEAKNAGADHVGGKELLDQIAKGWFEFDVMRFHATDPL